MIFQAASVQKQATVAVLTSNKAMSNNNRRDKESHHILVIGTIHQKDIIIINI